MVKEKCCTEIKSSPLFEGISDGVLKKALESAQVRAFQPCDEIDVDGSLAFVLSGSVNAYSADSRRRLLLRRINTGEVFGAAGLFSKDGCAGRIYSKGVSKIIFFDMDTVKYMLEKDSAFMYGYISFLSGRIGYLNNKITYLTAGSAERKLALFLDSFAGDRLRLPVNLTAVSDMLDIGRASLYRALDRMAADRCIEREGNNITILDRKNMLENY